jgi:ATP-dependent Clp protease ATP-binding subunit ClpC
MKSNVLGEVKKTFNPEFINRVDEIIVFHSLNKDHMLQILDLHLDDIAQKIAPQGLKIKYTAAAKEYLVENGFDPRYGARPLLRSLQRNLEDPLAEYILSNKFAPDTLITADADKKENKIIFNARSPKTAKKNVVSCK